MLFENVTYFGEDFHFHRGSVEIDNGRITRISEAEQDVGKEGKYLIAGLVDLHCHGNSGYDFSDGDYQGLTEMARYLAINGVTSFSPASMALPEHILENAFRTAAKLRKAMPEGTAKLQGITMEGPFFSVKYKGAQAAEYLRDPDEAMFDRLNKAADKLIRIVCAAPELRGADVFISSVSKKAVVSIAHTAADYNTTVNAIKLGASHLTHLFNGMPPMHHRAPGVIGAASENGRVTAELICDGVHVHESMVRAAFRLFGSDRVVLISDSVRACGMADGTYTLGGQLIRKQGNAAAMEDGTLAGSVTNLFECMKKAISFGISKEAAVRAATYNPAVVLGIQNEVGSISIGKSADLILCSHDFIIENVYINGKPVVFVK